MGSGQGTWERIQHETVVRLRHELDEAQAEIERHHRDFAKISEIVEKALNSDPRDAYLHALTSIRRIVG